MEHPLLNKSVRVLDKDGDLCLGDTDTAVLIHISDTFLTFEVTENSSVYTIMLSVSDIECIDTIGRNGEVTDGK